MLIINEGEILDVRSTKKFDWKMSVQVAITVRKMRLLFHVYRVPMEYFKVPL